MPNSFLVSTVPRVSGWIREGTRAHSRLVYLNGFLIRVVDLANRIMNVDNLVRAMPGLRLLPVSSRKPDKNPLSDLELNLPSCAIITLLLLDLSCLDACMTLHCCEQYSMIAPAPLNSHQNFWAWRVMVARGRLHLGLTVHSKHNEL